MKSKAASSRSGGTFQATRAPEARLVASKVWRTRRIVPASSIMRIRLSRKIQRESSLAGDRGKGIADKAGDLVLGNREDPGIYRIGMLDGDHATHLMHCARRSARALTPYDFATD